MQPRHATAQVHGRIARLADGTVGLDELAVLVPRVYDARGGVRLARPEAHGLLCSAGQRVAARALRHQRGAAQQPL
jgi:hypothetical protein